MSAFLGPIHFWLYNKIRFQEDLIDALCARAVSEGWITEEDTQNSYLQIAVNFKTLLMNQTFTVGYKAVFMTAKVAMPLWLQHF